MSAILLVFVTAVVAVSVTAAVAQPPPAAIPRVATLGSEPTPVWDVFQQRLAALGYVDGRNVILERRWSQGFTERVPALVTELLTMKPHVLVTSMLPPAPRIDAALCAPILAIGVAAPYGSCRVFPVARMSLASTAAELSAAHFRLATTVVPAASRFVVVTNTSQPFLVEYVRGLEQAAASRRTALTVLDVTGESDLIAAVARHGPDAMIVAPAFGQPHARKQLVHYATRRRIPVVGTHLADGVVVAADYDWVDLGRRTAEFVDEVLKGVPPTSLRVDVPVKMNVIVDRRAAAALGLTLSESLLSQADQVLD